MKTARIVVLTIAVGAGGTAACHATGLDNMLLPARHATADHRRVLAALPTLSIQMSAAASAGEIALQYAAARNDASGLGRNAEVTERTPV